MKLFLLKRIENSRKWDVNNGFVIRAKTSDVARIGLPGLPLMKEATYGSIQQNLLVKS